MELKKEQLSTGFIKLYRSVRSNWLWEESVKKSKLEAWLYLLFAASYTNQKIVDGYQIIELNRGQVLTSQERLSIDWGWPRSNVRRFLDLLQRDGMILVKSGQKMTIITICNYDTYNDRRPESGQKVAKERPESGHIEEGLEESIKKEEEVEWRPTVENIIKLMAFHSNQLGKRLTGRTLSIEAEKLVNKYPDLKVENGNKLVKAWIKNMTNDPII